MDFDRIMREIAGGLTGDGAKDVKYLMGQMEKYKDHEMGKEIVRACGRLMYQCVPEEAKAELSRVIGNDRTAYESVLEEARFKQHEKKFGEALAMAENLIRRVETSDIFTDDRVSEYHCFNEFFEEALYRRIAKPEKDVRTAAIPMDKIYMQQGSVLIDLRRLDEADAALAKAMRWNPADARIAFERAEICKLRGDMDMFFGRTLDAFRYAFRPNQVARCYRNLGYYFTERQLWQESAACYTMSLQFERESAQAMSELYYIQQKAGRVIPPPDMDYLQEISEKYGFPVGADPDVLGMAYSCGKHFAENGDSAGARYCWQILYDLTDDEDIQAMMDKLPPEE